MQTQPTPATALADWSQRLRNRASGMLGVEDPRKLPAALASAMDRYRPGQTPLDPHLVAHWLRGDCAPETPDLHEAILQALGLAEKNGQPLDTKTGQMRWDMSLLYAMIDQRFKTVHVDEVCAKPQPRIRIGTTAALSDGNAALKPNGNGLGYHTGNGSGIHSIRTANYADRPGLPPRLKPDHVAYAELDRGELDTLIGSEPEGTRNAHEFLSAFMARHNLNDHILATDIGCSKSLIGYIRNGYQLPGKGFLPKYEAAMKKYDSKAFTRFETLVLSNRLAHLAVIKASEKADPEHAIRNDYPADITREHDEMPQDYWIEMLARCNHARATRLKHRLPEEILSEQPLKTKGDYLRAARYAFGMSVRNACKAAHVNSNIFCLVEHYGNPEHASARERLASFFQQRDAARMEALRAEGKPAEPLFVAAVYNRLPNNVRGPYKKHEVGESAMHEGTLAKAPGQDRAAG